MVMGWSGPELGMGWNRLGFTFPGHGLSGHLFVRAWAGLH
jgi:hypothetical protein